jgi:hypothetical protein
MAFLNINNNCTLSRVVVYDLIVDSARSTELSVCV